MSNGKMDPHIMVSLSIIFSSMVLSGKYKYKSVGLFMDYLSCYYGILDLIFTFTHIRYHTGTLFTTTYIETDKISKLIDIVEKVIHVKGRHDDSPCAQKDGNHFDKSR